MKSYAWHDLVKIIFEKKINPSGNIAESTEQFNDSIYHHINQKEKMAVNWVQISMKKKPPSPPPKKKDKGKN